MRGELVGIDQRQQHTTPEHERRRRDLALRSLIKRR
jgi:hypothetical protein